MERLDRTLGRLLLRTWAVVAFVAALGSAAFGMVVLRDGQPCTVDLAVRCTLPAPAATALAVDAATRATDPVTTAVNPVDSGSVE